MNAGAEQLRNTTRRHFFRKSGVGLGAIALASLLSEDARPEAMDPANLLSHKPPHHAPRVKNVIFRNSLAVCSSLGG